MEVRSRCEEGPRSGLWSRRCSQASLLLPSPSLLKGSKPKDGPDNPSTIHRLLPRAPHPTGKPFLNLPLPPKRGDPQTLGVRKAAYAKW